MFNMKQKRKQNNIKKNTVKINLIIVMMKNMGNIKMDIKSEYKLATG